MNSDFQNTISCLDQSLALLSKAIDKVPRIISERQETYDSYEQVLCVSIKEMLLSVRMQCVYTTYATSVAFYSFRPMYQLGIKNITVNMRKDELDTSEVDQLRAARLAHCLAYKKDAPSMHALLEQVKGDIDPELCVKIAESVEKFKKNGSRRKATEALNRIADDTFGRLFDAKFSGETDEHPIMTNFLRSDFRVLLSALLHGNPLFVSLAADEEGNPLTVPFFLLRITLYSAELIAKSVDDRELLAEVSNLQNHVIAMVGWNN